MTHRTLLAAVLLSAAAALPAASQAPGRLLSVSVEPYVGYGFFGTLPTRDARLEGDWMLGARAGLRLLPQWSAFGDFRRSTPRVTGRLPFGVVVHGEHVTVEHWSAGLAYSQVPRGGAEGMLPLALEAGVGQARYEGGPTDLALNLGISSGIAFSPNLAIRYGANSYVSNFDGDRGWTNQVFLTVGAQLSL
ncbi:MAG TPA: hypothetical protein VGR37_15145 [Longimicrobiaceae bacterium]|nr:hypothetical protein [Longimicrobiaceae bacterium]